MLRHLQQRMRAEVWKLALPLIHNSDAGLCGKLTRLHFPRARNQIPVDDMKLLFVPIKQMV
jgi:hypothetical protein